jgi:hypothetical protein
LLSGNIDNTLVARPDSGRSMPRLRHKRLAVCFPHLLTDVKAPRRDAAKWGLRVGINARCRVG